MTGLKKWTGYELRLLGKLYPVTPNRILGEMFGRTVAAIKCAAQAHGFSKSPTFMSSPEFSGRFRKGQIPWTAGRKMPYNANSARTQFKKGALPHNTVPVGTEVVDREGYLKRKVSDRRDVPSRRNWRFVHRILWEQHHGKIPENHIVIFKNGDRSDIRIENLKCISMQENARKNRARYPEEIHRISRLIGAINRQVKKKEKNHG